MEALQRASDIYQARARLKRRIKAREAFVSDALMEMPDCIKTMTVVNFIAVMPGMGKRRARNWLLGLSRHGVAHISEWRKCGELTDRERKVLAERLAGKERNK